MPSHTRSVRIQGDVRVGDGTAAQIPRRPPPRNVSVGAVFGSYAARAGRRPSRPREETVLLDGDLGAGLFELGLGSLGSVLVDLLEDRLRSTLDEVLGFLQAQAGDDLADDLDDLDLLVAGRPSRTTSNSSCSSAASAAAAGAPAAATATGAAAVTSKVSSNAFTNSESSSRVSSLNCVEQLFGGELRHGGGPSCKSHVADPRPDGMVHAGACVGFASAIGGSADQRQAAASSASFFSCSAAARRATCEAGALNRPAAFAKLPFIAPASLANRTSRDSRSAIWLTSIHGQRSAVHVPALDDECLVVLGEVLDRLRCVDRLALDERDGGRTDEQVVETLDARLCGGALDQGVLGDGVGGTVSESATQLSQILPTDRPRYSVTTAAVEPLNCSVISATAETFSGFAILRLLSVTVVFPVSRLGRPTGNRRAGNDKRPGAGHTGRERGIRTARRRSFRNSPNLVLLRGPPDESGPSTDAASNLGDQRSLVEHDRGGDRHNAELPSYCSGTRRQNAKRPAQGSCAGRSECVLA